MSTTEKTTLRNVMTDTLYNRIWETAGKKVGYGVDCDALTDALMDIFNEEKKKGLKEQALEALQFVDEKLDLPLLSRCNAIHTIRTALEALPND